MNINKEYILLCKKLLKAPTNNGTRELLNYTFTIDSYKPIVTLKHRSLSKKYIIAELLWYWNERNDAAFIGQFAKKWLDITDDGKTNNSAYGYIIGKKYNFNQIEQIIEVLSKDPGSRRAIININYAHNNKYATKDEPCTIALQLYIRDGKLHMTGIMRSNDIWYGLPYDIIYFTSVQRYIAYKLKIPSGNYTHFATSLHVYETDVDKLKKIVKDNNQDNWLIDSFKLIMHKEYLIKNITKDNILELAKEVGAYEILEKLEDYKNEN
jgi:thymidylate synthase